MPDIETVIGEVADWLEPGSDWWTDFELVRLDIEIDNLILNVPEHAEGYLDFERAPPGAEQAYRKLTTEAADLRHYRACPEHQWRPAEVELRHETLVRLARQRAAPRHELTDLHVNDDAGEENSSHRILDA
jgi:hypothetical protein